MKSVGCFDPPYDGTSCEDNAGSIQLDGNEISPNRQGFNFAVIDLKTGKLEDTETFNTHGIAGAYEKMESFIDGLPDWKIIVAAIREDAKDNLPASSLAKFVSFSNYDLKVLWRRGVIL